MQYRKVYMSGASTPQSEKDFIWMYIAETGYTIACIRQDRYRKEVNEYDIYYNQKLLAKFRTLTEAKTYIENLVGCNKLYDKVYMQDLVNRIKRALRKGKLDEAIKYYRLFIDEKVYTPRDKQIKEMYASQFTQEESDKLLRNLY